MRADHSGTRTTSLNETLYSRFFFRSYRGLHILHEQIYIFSSQFRFTLSWLPTFGVSSFCSRNLCNFPLNTRRGCILVVFFCWPPPNACCTAVWQQEERPKKPVANLINKRVLFALTFISLSLCLSGLSMCATPVSSAKKEINERRERPPNIYINFAFNYSYRRMHSPI